MNPSVHSLFIYPLKSAQGISLEEMIVDKKGPRFDREWMLVDENNHFISQRRHAKLSQIKTELTDSHLILSNSSQEALRVSLEPNFNSLLEVKIFSDVTPAQHLNTKYDDWFSHFLGSQVKLVRVPEGESRQTSGRNGPKTNLRFADGYPFLLTNTATLEELNTKLTKTIEMSRFRPNIVVQDTSANSEDQWSELTIGNIHFLSVKSCTRCKIIDIDPLTGQSSKEVTRTLSQYRTKDGNMIFGNNLSHTQTGKIQVGDSLKSIQFSQGQI